MIAVRGKLEVGEGQLEPASDWPPPPALDWVAARAGGSNQVVAVRPLAAARWHAAHVVTVRDSQGQRQDLVLRRWTRPRWRIEDPDLTPGREATVLQLMASSPVPTPRLISFDPDGSGCDVPAILTDLLPGEPPGTTVEVDSLVAQLEETLVAIHAVPSELSRSLPRYRSYHQNLFSTVPPPWAGDQQLWLQAAARVGRPAPPGREALIHRDYHPGNTLWQDGRLTGVVDWTQASWGPVGVDTGHMRWNLAILNGEDAADDFLAQYQRRAGIGGGDQAYWDVATVLDLLPDFEPDDWGDGATSRLEGYLRTVLGRAG